MDDLLAEMERCLQSIHKTDENASNSTGMEVFYPSKYKSCIRIKGKPLLPPLMTESRRVEMQNYKEAALRKELELERNRLRTSARNEDTDYPHETGSSERSRYTENNELDESTYRDRLTTNSASTSELDLDTSVDLPDNSHQALADASTGNWDGVRKISVDREMESVLKDGKHSVLMDSLPSTASSSDVSALNQTVINLSDLPEQNKDEDGNVSSEMAVIPQEGNNGTEGANFTQQESRNDSQQDHTEDEDKASALLQQSFSDTESFISFVGEYNKLPTPTPSSSTPEVLESTDPVLEVDVTPTNEGGSSRFKATDEKCSLFVSGSPEHSPGSLDDSARICGTLDTNTSSLGSLGQSCTLPISVTESSNSTLADISERLDTPSIMDEISLNLKADQSSHGETVSSRDRSGSGTDSSIPSTVRRGPVGQEADRCEGNKTNGSEMPASNEKGTSSRETQEESSEQMYSSPARHIRRNSYTLDTTSPALLAAKARNEAPEAPLALNLNDESGSPEEDKKMSVQKDDIARITSTNDNKSEQEKEITINEMALVNQLELLEEIKQRLATEQKQQLEELLKKHTREQWLLEKEMTDVQRRVMKSRAAGGQETNPSWQEASGHKTSFSVKIGVEVSKNGENCPSDHIGRNADPGVISGSQQVVPRFMSSVEAPTREVSEDLSGIPKWLSPNAVASVQDSLEKDQSHTGTVFGSHATIDRGYEYDSTWSSAMQNKKEENRHGSGMKQLPVGQDREENPMLGQQAEDEVPSAYFTERLLTASEAFEVMGEGGSGFYLEDGGHGKMEGIAHEIGEQSWQPSLRMEERFNMVSAAAKGFLTRRLMGTLRVQEIVKTIKDSTEFIFKLQMETPIKGGNISSQDMALTQRILNQLRAAKFELHDIFHSLPPTQRISVIQQDRESQQQLRNRKSLTEDDVPSRPLSAATIKAMERRKKAKEVQKKVFGLEVGTKGQQTISQTRPKSAPYSRILKQLQQGHEAPSFPTRPVSSAAYRSNRGNNVTRITSNHNKMNTREDVDQMTRKVASVQHNKPQKSIRRVLYPATTTASKKKITRKQAPKKPFKP